jgi:hypothetical protein
MTETNEHNIIVSPGKFEGEHISTLYAWDIVLNGFEDDTWYNYNDETIDVVLVRPATELYTLTNGIPYAILLWTTYNGFVHAVWVDSYEELSNLKAAHQATLEETDNDA